MRSLLATAGRACGVLAPAALVIVLAGCSEKPSKEDCARLLDHIIDLEVRAAGTDKITPEMRADLDSQRKQVKDSMADKFLQRCEASVPVSVVTCGLAAKTPADYAACEKQ